MELGNCPVKQRESLVKAHRLDDVELAPTTPTAPVRAASTAEEDSA